MIFLNSWALILGAVAAGLPVLIHWLTRPRPRVWPLATVRFVFQAVRQRRARHRVRDFLVLALRTLAVLLLAAAVARPVAGQRGVAPDDVAGGLARVVLIDVSQSMGARSGGIAVVERARSLAAGHLAYRPGLAANLVLAGAVPRPVFDRLSTNFGALREALGKAAPHPERMNVQAALDEAARLLGGAGKPVGRRELVILSDFQRTQWAAADFSTLPRDTELRLESVAPRDTSANLAILRVGASRRAELGRPLTIEVDVGNFGPAPREVEVEVAIGEAIYHLAGPCRARGTTTLTSEIVPRAAGWQSGRARLLGVNDALAEDDLRPLAIEIRMPPVYALITRQPVHQLPSSSYFLERALVPAEARDAPARARVVRFDTASADRDALAAADLVVLDHPGRLPDDLLALMAGSLRRGRGMLYVACEPADALNLKRLADLAGADLHLPVEFLPTPPGATRSVRFIAEFQRDMPPFRVFGDGASAAVAPLRFLGGLVSRPLPGALAEDLRARYGDRSACLVVSSCGAGTLAVLNADLGTSNLAMSSTFVPLIGELTAQLLLARSLTTPVLCGEPFAVSLPAGAGPVAGLKIVTAGAGTEHAIEVIEEPEGLVCRSPAAGPPGVSRFERDGRAVFLLATALSDQESDLTPLTPSVFQDRLAAGRSLSYHDANRPDDRVDAAWSWLVVACLACLGAELVTLRAFRS